MLTDNKEITTPEYWQGIYEGKRNDKPTDASNFKRPVDTFDRFKWLAEFVEGPRVLDIASGHAHTMKRLKKMHPDWIITCSDQTPAAKAAAQWDGLYHIMDAYQAGNKYGSKEFNSVTISQALEYLEFPDLFMKGVRKISDYFICTVPDGEMKQWSQLRVYDMDSLAKWLEQYGEIVHFDKVPGLLLAKIKFNG